MQTLGTGAAIFNIDFQIGSNRTVIFDFGVDVSTWTFEFILRQNKGDRVKTLSFTLGSGLSFPVYVSDQIQATFTSTNTSITEGEYYWELRRTDLNLPLINGYAYFDFEAKQGTSDDVSLGLTVSSQTISVSISNILSVIAASQSEVDSETNADRFVNSVTLAGKALKSGTYSTALNFNTDQDIYKDATGLSITFTLGTDNINGKGIFLRLNKPTAVTFPVNFVADSSSSTLDSTKMNVYLLVFFTNWDGSGTDKVIYKNSLFTSV
jgi:hypothetical protein